MATDSNYLIYYHGSGNLFNSFDIRYCNPNADFGRGVYLTQSKRHARSNAEKHKRINNVGFIYTVALPKNFAQLVNVLAFTDASTDWVDFIVQNRTNGDMFNHGRDAVFGPTADAAAISLIDDYTLGRFGAPFTNSAKLRLISALKINVYPKQLCLATYRAIGLAQIVNVEQL